LAWPVWNADGYLAAVCCDDLDFGSYCSSGFLGRGSGLPVAVFCLGTFFIVTITFSVSWPWLALLLAPLMEARARLIGRVLADDASRDFWPLWDF